MEMGKECQGRADGSGDPQLMLWPVPGSGATTGRLGGECASWGLPLRD